MTAPCIIDVVIAETVTPTPSTHVHLTVSAIPRFEQLPSP